MNIVRHAKKDGISVTKGKKLKTYNGSFNPLKFFNPAAKDRVKNICADGSQYYRF
jgi:mannitol-1-phosphate/altronate dehydrogenase